jgi:hypothetical protein
MEAQIGPSLATRAKNAQTEDSSVSSTPPMVRTEGSSTPAGSRLDGMKQRAPLAARAETTARPNAPEPPGMQTMRPSNSRSMPDRNRADALVFPLLVRNIRLSAAVVRA